MQDRELLEKAAKAARLPECGWMGPAFMYVKDNTFADWNPLADDGDRMRLARQLKLVLDFDGQEVRCYPDKVAHVFPFAQFGGEARAVLWAATAMARG